MKLKSLLTGLAVMAAMAAAAATNELTARLQQGLFEEEANQDLNAAIADYQSLAKQFDQDRTVAATAIYRLGECYRKLGQTNEAAGQYQRLLRDFPDQPKLTGLSRQSLAGMNVAPAAGPAAEGAGAKPDPELLAAVAEVGALKAQIQVLDKADLLQARVIAQESYTNQVLTALMQKLTETELAYVKATNYYSLKNAEVTSVVAQMDLLNREIDEQIAGIRQGLAAKLQAAEAKARLFQGQAGQALAGEPATAPIRDEEDTEIQRIQQKVQDSPDLINAPSYHLLDTAVAAGQLRVAGYLLDHGADINLVSLGQNTALNTAAREGNKAMVEFLLSRGAEVNGRSPEGGTALHTAVEGGYQAVAEVLLTHHADANARFSRANHDRTPLHVAVEHGYLNLVSLLLKNGADVNATNSEGTTPLVEAVSLGWLPIAKNLVAAGADVNQADLLGRTPLSHAAALPAQADPAMLHLLLDAKADPNQGTSDAPLLCAIRNRNATATELLLQAGADPNARGNIDWVEGAAAFDGNRGWTTPLYEAIGEGKLAVVQLLLKFKANPDDTQATSRPLLFSVLQRPDLLEAMLAAGAKVDARDLSTVDNNTLLLLLAGLENRHDYETNVAILLQYGADANAVTSFGNSPLHLAADRLASPELFTLLLAHHANPNVQNAEGKTPLDLLKEKLRQANANGSATQGAAIFYTTATGEPGQTLSPVQQAVRAKQLIDLLRQHGALDRLPDWKHIMLSRSSANFTENIFSRVTNDWNHFTLLELLVAKASEFAGPNSSDSFRFPDLSRITVVRPGTNGAKEARLEVNLIGATNAIDFTRDVSLEFGDNVEIPERPHTLADTDNWYGEQMQRNFTHLKEVAGSVKLVVAGGPATAIALNSFDPIKTYIGTVLMDPAAQTVLTSESNLRQVKVTRTDAKTGKTVQWVVDCSQMGSNPTSYQARILAITGQNQHLTPDLLIRDGDVIEVPQK